MTREFDVNLSARLAMAFVEAIDEHEATVAEALVAIGNAASYAIEAAGGTKLAMGLSLIADVMTKCAEMNNNVPEGETVN